MAYRAGQLAATLGYTIVTGGFGGVMEAASAGAKSAKGRTIGIMPSVDVIVALAGDVMIALPGGHDTLQEITFALEYRRPVAAWDSWSLSGVALFSRADSVAIQQWLEEQREILMKTR
jgi:predicted Rossmann-fold nucleotide-binding protein